MNNKIRDYINELFRDAPKTKKTLELKEEMITNAEEKLADYIAEGYREEDALVVVINSIGNVEELFYELGNTDEEYAKYNGLSRELQQKKAKYTAIAVGLYIFAGAVFLFGGLLDEVLHESFPWSILGLLLAAIICIIPTVMLVYVSMMMPKYKKREDNMVEDYKEWKSDAGRDKEIRKAISSIIWTVTVVVYLFVSFITMMWYITWIIFLIALCIEALVQLLFSLRK